MDRAIDVGLTAGTTILFAILIWKGITVHVHKDKDDHAE